MGETEAHRGWGTAQITQVVSDLVRIPSNPSSLLSTCSQLVCLMCLRLGFYLDFSRLKNKIWTALIDTLLNKKTYGKGEYGHSIVGFLDIGGQMSAWFTPL